MIKLYVDAKIRLNSSTHAFAQRVKAYKDEKGFVSAETIALAVAGVLIVTLLLGLFKTQLSDAVSNLFSNLFPKGDSGSGGS